MEKGVRFTATRAQIVDDYVPAFHLAHCQSRDPIQLLCCTAEPSPWPSLIREFDLIWDTPPMVYGAYSTAPPSQESKFKTLANS